MHGTEHLGNRAFRMTEGRRNTIRRGQFTHIGPKVNRAGTRLEGLAVRVMMPAVLRAVSRGTKPALVAAHNSSRQPFALNPRALQQEQSEQECDSHGVVDANAGVHSYCGVEVSANNLDAR